MPKRKKVVEKRAYGNMGKTHVYEDGTKHTFLNPHGKGKKYAAELKNDRRYTNSGDVKVDGDGVVLGLTKEQKAYRAGYLDAQKDSARVYKAKHVGK